MLKPKLFESLIRENSEFKEHAEKLKLKCEHPFLKRYAQMGVKEGFFSDMTGALGRMHDTLVDTAWPELVGRALIKVKSTSEPLERFPLDAGAIAYEYAEGAVTRLSSKKKSTVDISTNILADASDEFTREYLEDATWNVVDNTVENVGSALGQKETEKIIALYGAIADADLAGGAVVAGGGAVLSWAGLLAMHNAVRGENWRPTVLAVNEMQLHQLLNDDKFIHAQYLPSGQTDLDQGTVTSVLGMRIHATTLVPNGTAFAIDTRVAGVMLLRRDVTVEDWEQGTVTSVLGMNVARALSCGSLAAKLFLR
jgi:hypothetical protein